MVKLLFSTESGLVSAGIRAFTWSPWSHVDIVFGDWMIGAYPGAGVQHIPLAERIAQARDFALFDVPGLDDAKAEDCALAEVGKAYDWSGVVGIGLHRDWQSPDKWFCSELAAYVARQCGVELLGGDYRRITPGMLALSPVLVPSQK